MKKRLAMFLAAALLVSCGSPSPAAPTEPPAPTPTPQPAATATPEPTPTIAATPTPLAGATQVRETDGMVMVYVPAAEFAMGSESGSADELPLHTVYLDSYWIDQTEVTNAMYAQCVAAGACVAPSEYLMDRMTGYYSGPPAGDYPVVNMDWYMANAYCAWAGARLPSEAEWELAARGTDGRAYPWGNEAPNDDLTNYFRHVGDLQPVGSYPDAASPYGALDMAGNAWEWVNDWYSSSYYSESPADNPQGPASGEYRVARGGSWFIIEDFLRSTARLTGFTPPEYYFIDSGFRCAFGTTP